MMLDQVLYNFQLPEGTPMVSLGPLMCTQDQARDFKLTFIDMMIEECKSSKDLDEQTKLEIIETFENMKSKVDTVTILTK